MEITTEPIITEPDNSKSDGEETCDNFAYVNYRKLDGVEFRKDDREDRERRDAKSDKYSGYESENKDETRNNRLITKVTITISQTTTEYRGTL